MKKIRAVAFIFGAVSSACVSAVNVDISINGATKQYVLTGNGIQVGASGQIVVYVTDPGGTVAYPQDYTLKLDAVTNGKVVLSKVGEMVQPENAPIPTSFTCISSTECSPYKEFTLAAVPDAGYKLKNWKGVCVGNSLICPVTISSNLNVGAEFEPDTPPPTNTEACNPAGSTLEEIATSIPTKPYNRVYFSNVVAPNAIYAFKFRTPDTAEVMEGKLSAAKLSNSMSNKWVVISECKGDIRRDDKPAGCARYSPDATVITTLVNSPGYKPDSYCNLKPNTQYYANVVSPGKLTGLSENACTSVTNCGFSFLGN